MYVSFACLPGIVFPAFSALRSALLLLSSGDGLSRSGCRLAKGQSSCMDHETVPSPGSRALGRQQSATGQKSELGKAWFELEKRLSRIPLDDKGATTRDEDGEYQASLLLASEGPEIQNSLVDLPNYDTLSGCSIRARKLLLREFYQSRKVLFARWCKLCSYGDPGYWWGTLPYRFKFALKRPFMSVNQLEHQMRSLGVHQDWLKSRKDQENHSEQGRMRLKGVDVDSDATVHPSLKYRDIMGEMDRESYYNLEQSETVAGRLYQAWASFREGILDKNVAIDQYQAILQAPGLSDWDLACHLEGFGIPRTDVIGDEFSSDVDFTQLTNEESEVIKSVAELVRAHRAGEMSLEAAIERICDELSGNQVDDLVFISHVRSRHWSHNLTAMKIWEWSLLSDPADYPEISDAIGATLINGTKLERIAIDFLDQYGGRIDLGLPPQVALAEFTQRTWIGRLTPAQASYVFNNAEFRQQRSHGVEHSDLQFGLANDEHDAQDSIVTHLPSLTNPTSNHLSTTPLIPTIVETNDIVETTKLESKSQRRHYDGCAGYPLASDYMDLSSSPEEGVTDSLWGLKMPTKEARKFGREIGLPSTFVRSRIRSSTPRRISGRRHRKSSVTITSSNKKREASTSIHEGRRLRTSPQGREDTPFAELGEDQATFVRKNFGEGSYLINAGKLLSIDPPNLQTKTAAEDSVQELIRSGTSTSMSDAASIAPQNEALRSPADADQSSSQLYTTSKAFDQLDLQQGNIPDTRTVFSYLKNRMPDITTLGTSSVQDLVFSASIADELLRELDEMIRRGDLQEPNGTQDRQAIVLLICIARKPGGSSLSALKATLAGDWSESSKLGLDPSSLSSDSPAYSLLSYFGPSLPSNHGTCIQTPDIQEPYSMEPSTSITSSSVTFEAED